MNNNQPNFNLNNENNDYIDKNFKSKGLKNENNKGNKAIHKNNNLKLTIKSPKIVADFAYI